MREKIIGDLLAMAAGEMAGPSAEARLREIATDLAERGLPAVEIEDHWRDNHEILTSLVGADELWIGESHYPRAGWRDDLGYRLRSNEAMALLPAGQHIIWQVQRDPEGIVSYPHFPQIGEAGWHGPVGGREYFDLRVPQLKKELLMLYLEWLERRVPGAGVETRKYHHRIRGRPRARRHLRGVRGGRW